MDRLHGFTNLFSFMDMTNRFGAMKMTFENST